MIDPTAELQQLRKRTLTVNEVCHRWAAAGSQDDSVLNRSALVTWRLARVITGWLYSHPDDRFHPTPSPLVAFADAVNASHAALTHLSRGRQMRWLREQVDFLEHRTAFINASSWSREVNDMLSRHHPALKDLRRALREQELALIPAAAPVRQEGADGASATSRQRVFISSGQEWPYLCS